MADWGSVGGGRHIWPPSAASVSRSANAVMLVIVLALSVVGGGCEDGAFAVVVVVVVVCGGIANVRVGFAGRSFEGFLSSKASWGLGAISLRGRYISLRGRDIAIPMVGSRSSLPGYDGIGGGCAA